jgi:hypothetical protein
MAQENDELEQEPAGDEKPEEGGTNEGEEPVDDGCGK